jgi:glycosyltransferase involved in cell wall biosynthesis
VSQQSGRLADDVGQVEDYTEHLVPGCLVAPGQTGSFAQEVMRLLRDQKMRAALGARTRRRVAEQFGWPKLSAVAERAYTVSG